MVGGNNGLKANPRERGGRETGGVESDRPEKERRGKRRVGVHSQIQGEKGASSNVGKRGEKPSDRRKTARPVQGTRRGSRRSRRGGKGRAEGSMCMGLYSLNSKISLEGEAVTK